MGRGPLLETKLQPPRRGRGHVSRPRLSDRLRLGTESKLTLVAAPTGFGKTTLLADWLGNRSASALTPAWLSLDASDNDPASFWTYLIAALQTAAPGGFGATVLSMLQGGRAPIRVVLTALVNELTTATGDAVLVLDDYHAVDHPEIEEGMAFLIEHLPRHVHIVIVTQVDPALPLARLRARGELAEIRAADLRFTRDEAAAYLQGMGLDLAAPDVASLDERTEGWIAALQLAAVSMQGRDDVAAYVTGFSGDDRYIVDYLVEEVLQRQPADVRDFLVQTSILDALTGPLCDAVTGQQGGTAMLEALERSNLFLIALDDRRQWYRYHHLFADVLHARLLDEQAEVRRGLHARASAWYEQHGNRTAAIGHALAGEDPERAADLIELAMPELLRSRREATVRQWLEALPEELFRVRPVLSNGYAGSHLVRGELEGVEERLRDAERWLSTEDRGTEEPTLEPAEMVVVDDGAFRRLPSAVAIHRAGQAQILGDVAGTIRHARRALDLATEDDHFARGGASALLALAYWTSGDVDAAYEWYADGIANLERAGFVADAIGFAMAVADIRLAQGRLSEAARVYQQGLGLAGDPGTPVPRGVADMYVGLSKLHRERGDLRAAIEHLEQARRLGDDNGLPQNRYRSHVAAARIRQSQGDVDGAVQLLAEAKRLHIGDYFPNVRPVAALRARMLIAQGNLAAAWAWAREHGVTAARELSYLHEYEHATLARLLVAQGRHEAVTHHLDAAIDLTDGLLRTAERDRRDGSVIDILVVQALAYHARSQTGAAVDALDRAVALAESEGYLRVFIDEGAPMAALLKVAASRRAAPVYERKILAAAVTADAPTTPQPLIEPLSERELEVLRLLGTDLDRPGIARHLTVSPNTVRTHTKNIYAKLGVNSRRAAVRRASELDLLGTRSDSKSAA